MARPPIFVLFGGTFNPIHLGHVGLVEGLRRREGVARIFVIPTSRNPFKGGEELLPPDLRFRMAAAALKNVEGAEVIDVEIRRDQPAYTVETLLTLAADHPTARFRLAMGWDVFQHFAEWRQPATILAEAGLLVVVRAGVPEGGGTNAGVARNYLPLPWRERLLERNGALVDEHGRQVVEFVNFDLPDISSSAIRRERKLDWVPSGARELLAAHWRSQESG